MLPERVCYTLISRAELLTPSLPPFPSTAPQATPPVAPTAVKALLMGMGQSHATAIFGDTVAFLYPLLVDAGLAARDASLEDKAKAIGLFSKKIKQDNPTLWGWWINRPTRSRHQKKRAKHHIGLQCGIITAISDGSLTTADFSVDPQPSASRPAAHIVVPTPASCNAWDGLPQAIAAGARQTNPTAAAHLMMAMPEVYGPHSDEFPPMFATTNYQVVVHSDPSDDGVAGELNPNTGRAKWKPTPKEELPEELQARKLCRQWAAGYAAAPPTVVGEWVFALPEQGFYLVLQPDCMWTWMPHKLHGTAVLDTSGRSRHTAVVTLPLATAAAIRKYGLPDDEDNPYPHHHHETTTNPAPTSSCASNWAKPYGSSTSTQSG
ncbi:uncharacterized protein EV422DRAFT_607402 [Fimicolochytrium jonesii]|uniref:uncharacterized protein n=1 Tax=Fimicolochytrium jonesii TaxID=1396493 RepID=UPI0022FE6A11|nr:uncharacterized protein EV422DRAFT_607402 [Fimicolochytrium jonesii]KAI8816868.1 hypothetical protein EV422DRAFT_607402 [Fimicolochytrium jonesii]